MGDLLERVRATGLVGTGARSSSCSRAGATRPACWTSAWSWRAPARSVRCTSTTACGARRPTATASTAWCSASGLASRWRCDARGAERQHAGLGAQAALRGRGGGCRGTRPRRATGRRPHDLRSGRDDPLPTGGLAGAARAARDGRRDRAADPSAAGRRGDARRHRRVVRGAQAGMAGGRLNQDRAYARARVERISARAARRRRARQVNILRTARLLRDEGRSSTSWSPASSRAAITCRAPSSPRCRRRSAGSCCTGWPRMRSAASARRAATRSHDVLALGDDGTLDLGDGARAIVAGGTIRVGRPPAPPKRWLAQSYAGPPDRRDPRPARRPRARVRDLAPRSPPTTRA